MLRPVKPTRIQEDVLGVVAVLLPEVTPGDMAAMNKRRIEVKAQRQAIAEYTGESKCAAQCDYIAGPIFSPYCLLEQELRLAYIWTHVDGRGNITGPSLEWHQGGNRFDGLETFLLHYAAASKQLRFQRICDLQYAESPYALSVAEGSICESHCYICHDRHAPGQYECYIGNCPYGFHICSYCPGGLDNDSCACEMCDPCEDRDCLGSDYCHCIHACEVLCALQAAGHPLCLGVKAQGDEPPALVGEDEPPALAGSSSDEEDEADEPPALAESSSDEADEADKEGM
jgi:hypothetical protein